MEGEENMSNTYNVLEVSQMAINMEKSGHEYYLEAAKKAEGAKAKEIFLHLAGEEKKHIELFTDLYEILSETVKLDSGYQMDSNYLFDETVSAYLKYFVDEAVFKNEALGKITNFDAPKEVLFEGINAEKNSILFYSEMLKAPNAPEVTNVLDIIIDEEKKHLIQLTDMIKEL